MRSINRCAARHSNASRYNIETYLPGYDLARKSLVCPQKNYNESGFSLSQEVIASSVKTPGVCCIDIYVYFSKLWDYSHSCTIVKVNYTNVFFTLISNKSYNVA